MYSHTGHVGPTSKGQGGSAWLFKFGRMNFDIFWNQML